MGWWCILYGGVYGGMMVGGYLKLSGMVSLSGGQEVGTMQ